MYSIVRCCKRIGQALVGEVHWVGRIDIYTIQELFNPIIDPQGQPSSNDKVSIVTVMNSNTRWVS